jgi:hypothetical protein
MGPSTSSGSAQQTRENMDDRVLFPGMVHLLVFLSGALVPAAFHNAPVPPGPTRILSLSIVQEKDIQETRKILAFNWPKINRHSLYLRHSIDCIADNLEIPLWHNPLWHNKFAIDLTRKSFPAALGGPSVATVGQSGPSRQGGDYRHRRAWIGS